MKLKDLIGRTFQTNGSVYTVLGICAAWWVKVGLPEHQSLAMIVIKNENFSTYSKYIDFGSLEEWMKTVNWLT